MSATKQDIVVLGAGKIGQMVTHLLAARSDGDYSVRVGDLSKASVDHLTSAYGDTVTGQEVDFTAAKSLDSIMKGAHGVISCAPFHCNPLIAERAKAGGLNYFDLTEDVEVTNQVFELAKDAKSAFAPQCGLAPGFITIAAWHLLDGMTDIEHLRLRVGALPRYPDNRMKYNLTWSTAGLINEYCNPCEVVLEGETRMVQPLENLEEITIDGVIYEAFNTSGGLGSLADTLKGRAREVNYKTMRYPGHCELLKLLLHDLGFHNQQKELGTIFEENLAFTPQDLIAIYCSAKGKVDGRLTERMYANTVYHTELDNQPWTGIQLTTAAGVCAIVDMVKDGKLKQEGFVRMEDVKFTDFIKNRHGKHYAQK